MLVNLQNIVNQYLTFKTREGTYFNFRREGLHRFYSHEDKNKVDEESYYVNGVLHGESKSFYSSGILRRISVYNQGRIDGLQKTYHENEQLEEICCYVNGMMHGICKTYYSNGSIHSSAYYHGDKLHGEYKIYFLNGNLMSLSNMVLGMKHGMCYERGIWYVYKYDKLVG